MLHHVSDIGFRAGTFTVDPIPAGEIAAIRAVLADFHGSYVDSAALVPHEREDELRAALAESAPGVATLAAALRRTLDDSHSAILVPCLGLAVLDLDSRRFALYALALGIGSPTATDKIDRKVVWDIKARPEMLRAGTASTFSEHASEADFHTDTQYFPEPERYMLLYFIRPADCGGGRSSVRDAACIRDRLAATEEGRWALDLLSERELPFRIPATFTTTGRRDAVEVTFARVFGDRPRIRFRTDTLKRGLSAFPEHDTADVRRALTTLQAELDDPGPRLEHSFEADGAIFLNNHESVHGRGAFTDLERHALRIRIADAAPQDPARVVFQPAAVAAELASVSL